MDRARAPLAQETEQAEEARTRRALLHMLEDLQREQAAIRQARRDWIGTVDAISDPLMVHDADLRVVRCNRAYAARAGMPIAQIIGRPYWECFPRISGRLEACLLPTDTAEDRRATEFRLDTGEIFLSRAHAVGEAHVLRLFENVTERRAAEAALSASEEKFREIFEHTQDGIVLMNIEPPGVNFANGSMERLLGYAPGELAGLPLSRLHPEEHLAQVRQQFESGGRAALNIVQDIPMLTKDGGVVYADLTGAPVEFGGRRYLLGAFRDATARRAGEETLRAQVEELQRWQGLNLNREDRVIELKREVNELTRKLNLPPRYAAGE